MRGEQPTEPRISFLLGAGASADARLPMTGQLTRCIVESLPSSLALRFVCSALIGHRGVQGVSPFADLDVERVFSAVRLLAERRDHEAAPFVYAWNPGVDSFDGPPQGSPPCFGAQASDRPNARRGC